MSINSITSSSIKDKNMDLKIRILNDIVPSFVDYPDNESVSLCVVMMGCIHHCVNCQNPLFQNVNYNEGTRVVSVSELKSELIELCKRNRTNKIVLSGGDSLFPGNIDFTKELINEMKDEYDFCVYTGYEIDYVKENNVKGFKFVKCGRYIDSQKRQSDKTDEKIIFASPNQTLYNGDYELLSKNGVYYFNKN